jgi:Endonuclease-reverse transcriptase
MLNALQAPGQHLIVGDFNLHHPLWGGPNVTQAHAAADLLLDGMIQYQLEMLLPPRTITREKNNERSTLDLVLGTEGIASKVATCQVIDTFSGSDHLPIETTIQLEKTVQSNPPARYCFKYTNLEEVQAEAQHLQQPNNQLNLNPQEIDIYIDYLVQFIQNLIERTVPLSKPPSQQVQP